MAFGDSITAGTTSPVVRSTMSAGLPQSYPSKLLGLLSGRYVDQVLIVENEGRPGERAEAGVLRLPDTLRALKPEVVILLHGINDLAADGQSAVARTIAALYTMIRDVRLAGSRVVICTLLPQRPGGSRAVDPAAVASLNQGLRQIARIESAVLVDLAVEFDVSLIGIDGLHPTESGYVRMAEILFAALRNEFEQPPSLH